MNEQANVGMEIWNAPMIMYQASSSFAKLSN